MKRVNNAFIRKSTTNYTLDSVKGSPYTLSSDGRTVEDHASIELCNVTESLWKSRSTAIWPANSITVACDLAIRTIILHAASDQLPKLSTTKGQNTRTATSSVYSVNK
jgi:hypothetical protein